MNTDQLLREAAPDADALTAHARQLRSQVIAGFSDSHRLPGRQTLARAGQSRRRTGAVATGVLAAVLGVGGVAYAAGGLPLPRMFSDAISATDFVKDDPAMSQVVDLALPDGGRFAVWRGQSETAFCEASTDYSDRNETQKGYSGSVFCTDTLDGPAAEEGRVQLDWAAGKRETHGGRIMYPVIYGDTTTADATRVWISGTFVQTGKPVDLTVDIDPATHVFAAVLPGSSLHPWGKYVDPQVLDPHKFPADSGLTLTFIDDQGSVLDTRPVSNY